MKSPRYAVIDLETTGNQPHIDDIIQIGIVFIEQHAIVDTYHTMIKTDKEIPTFIQALTSIENHMLTKAPYFHEIADELFKKLQGCVFVAHNVNFDLNFLKIAFEQCHISYNPRRVIDTLELFKIAFPTAKSYQLSELAQDLNIPLTQAHRADEDAETTAKIMIRAFHQFEGLPIETKKQLFHLSKDLKFNLQDYFFELVRKHHSDQTVSPLLEQFEQIYYQPVYLFEKPYIDFDGDLNALYKKVVTQAGYQYREDQRYLTEVIYHQLMHDENALIEAETGSGKSLAYLIAAVMYYIETGEHVMISTNTKLLQYQLIQQDIPLINRALNTQLNACMVKSKKDYISLGLVQQIIKDQTNNYEVNLLKMQLLVWLIETHTGDIHELNLRGGVKMYLDQKIETYVPIRKDIDYYYQLRMQASHIQIGITNHAHLLKASGENVIYQLFDHCIIDEAHRLPDYALDCVVHEVGYADIKYQLGLIGKTENEKLLAQVDQLEQLRVQQKLNIAPMNVFAIKQDINEIHEMNDALFERLFTQIRPEQLHNDESSKRYDFYDLSTESLLIDIQQLIKKIHLTLLHFETIKHKTVKTLRKQLLNIVAQLKPFEEGIKQGNVFYVSLKNLDQKATIRLHIKQDDVKTILTEKLLLQFKSLTFISGTLTFNQSFTAFENWFKEDTAFNRYQIHVEPSKYENGYIFIPNDIEDYHYQNHDAYIQTIVEYISRYVSTTNGKCLVLFTSYQMMYIVMDYLNDISLFEDYVILAQQQSQNQKIVQQFNHFDKAILLGTSSFFEGFDYQAQGVKCVMIVKLPFMNQHATKPLLLKDEFSNIFKDYILPDAVTRFRQGLGRLLRNEHDKGIIVSFDNRLINSRFKPFFQKTIQPYHQQIGDIDTFEKRLKQLRQTEVEQKN
ncbi:ATP-dependent helicase [Staphylococcus muscae]|uniref:3'-5' exonuclease DinG n=1 Tax=Staphylococcus muscae TaxID=1294 RepID=A0A240C3W9_9STAP|nr:helicase C-terminal domain-containing protein [Staphylococcus muscae]AVQ33158.1 ATP-dependent helicase [Staphylococcus muscae]PNZ05654.1 ATP-dependent helicase [Staphylococcus muscae]GGA95599.1 putative ATP-dependent helicase DinG [Staphylococcus muscae]SNW02664.1 DnaQ family exonuclease/DinG family helicase [Staphylococcus muscae]